MYTFGLKQDPTILMSSYLVHAGTSSTRSTRHRHTYKLLEQQQQFYIAPYKLATTSWPGLAAGSPASQLRCSFGSPHALIGLFKTHLFLPRA